MSSTKMELSDAQPMRSLHGAVVAAAHSPREATASPTLAASHEFAYVTPVVEHTGSHTIGHSVVGGGGKTGAHSPADATCSPA